VLRGDRLEGFKNNPEQYIEQVAGIIQRQMRLFIGDGLKYARLGGQDCSARELFDENELFGDLSKNMMPSAKSVSRPSGPALDLARSSGTPARLRRIQASPCL